MAHLFPLHNLKRKQQDEGDESWRHCHSFKVDATPQQPAQNAVPTEKKQKKKKKHFKFKRDDEGNLFLRSISEIKRFYKSKYNNREVVVEGMIVEGERPIEDGAQCPFRSLPTLGAHAERMRLSDGDIILNLAEESPSSVRRLTSGKRREEEEFWESGMPMDVLIQCKGRVTSEKVAINTLYKGDDEDADLYVPKGTVRVFKVKVSSWSLANKLPPAITDSSSATTANPPSSATSISNANSIG